MRLVKPKSLDLKLRTKEDPWFQIQFYGGFVTAGLLGVYPEGAEDIKDAIVLMRPHRKSYGDRVDYDRAARVVKRVAVDLRAHRPSKQLEHLMRQLWLAVHKARARLA